MSKRKTSWPARYRRAMKNFVSPCFYLLYLDGFCGTNPFASAPSVAFGLICHLADFVRFVNIKNLLWAQSNTRATTDAGFFVNHYNLIHIVYLSSLNVGD